MEYKKIIRSILGNKKLTIENQLNLIKQNLNAGDYKEGLKMNPNFSRFLHKSPIFKTLNDIYLKEPFQFTGNFKKEYKWLTNILENYLEEIDNFLNQKNKFEIHILNEEFEEANSILNEIEDSFGVSLWSIEATLIIEERINGSESNWNKLSFYLTEINNPIYEFIINSSSKRIETKLSYESFLNQFQSDIDTINANGLIEDFFVFKNFNIVNYSYKYNNLDSVLYVSNVFSVIDQYLILVDVILFNISESNENDKLFLSFINIAKNYIKNDYRIINIYNTINEKKEIIQSERNSEILDCLNFYYSGQFTLALGKAKEGIRNFPNEYEYYEIYCKSLINLNKGLTSLGYSTIIDDILINTFDLLTFKKDTQESWKKLLKSSLFFMNSSFGKQIFGLLAEVEDKSKKNHIIGFLSSSFNSPKNLTLIKSRESIIDNYNILLNNHCFKIQLFKQGENMLFSEKLSEFGTQEIMFRAIRSFNKQNYKEVINLLEDNSDFNTNSYYFERKISLLYYSYFKLNLLKDALLLFGTVLLDNSIFTQKLNYFELFETIKETYNKEDFIHLIEYPILFSLISKEYDLYEAYDDFIYTLDNFNIKEFDTNHFIEKFSLERIIYFLNNVVTIDTLKYSTEYNSIGEVEENRIDILNILISIDSLNKLNYEKERNDIYRANSVRKVLKEVDEGRLYIDVSNLKEIQIKKFNDDFKRFKEIESSASNQLLIGFNTSTKNWEKILTEKNPSIEKYNSADYLAFKSIYLESRENFLFSKEYGLDSCLSTRIRHGALKNHIRSVFEKLHLVTSKFNDKYRDNEIWQDQLGNFPEFNIQVQSKLKQFSKEIDDYTIFIVEKLIQIQTEKISGKEEGVFKFFTNDETLFKYYTMNKASFETTDVIIEMLLTNLVNHTLIDLQKEINHTFTVTIPNKFQLIIDNLISNLREINLPNDCQLIPNLIKSSTEIQKELEQISDWFYLNTTSSSTLLSIETVIDASIELTNKINPTYKINPSINLKCQPFGVYSSLVFVFNILFNNIIGNSKLPFDKMDINIEIDSIDEKYFRINITNKINKNFNYTKNIVKLNKIKDNWNDHSNIDRSNKEGESGFDKIKRILIYETFSKTDKFDFLLENETITISLFFPYLKYEQDE